MTRSTHRISNVTTCGLKFTVQKRSGALDAVWPSVRRERGKVCKVRGGKGMFVIKIAFRAPTVECWYISKFAGALAVNILGFNVFFGINELEKSLDK